MKTILTEWGEMPLNDWREMKLKAAHQYASAALNSRIWANSIAALFFAVEAYIGINSGHQMAIGNTFYASIEFLLTVGINSCTFRVIAAGKEMRDHFLLKRQEIVDEVAAVMRTFK